MPEKKYRQYKRQETYPQLRTDMLAMYDEPTWNVLQSFIESAIVEDEDDSED